MLSSLLGKLPDGAVCGATNDSAPLLSPDLCSDPNSVSNCGIKGKFFLWASVSPFLKTRTYCQLQMCIMRTK